MTKKLRKFKLRATPKSFDVEVVALSIDGAVIPAEVRSELTDVEYSELERILSGRVETPVGSNADGIWDDDEEKN